jgi:hypothetical protein
MIDRISKLKDHVNVSIMKAVQVDESKDTLCSLGESLTYTDSNQLEDMKVFEYFLLSKKYTENLKAIVVDEVQSCY